MQFIENLISGTLPFAFLTVCGIYLSLSTHFCQITRFFESLKLTVKAFLKREKTKEITSVKSACTALSATVGTGNIAGVAGA
ncbi:MAG: sodium:alanine symporter family protein, partial [Clostridia bacterium]|nr:sodium:alanine symporter family protein [Clostridia bacterium]